MEIRPSWLGTDIETLMRIYRLDVCLSPGGWWFEKPAGDHICVDENSSDEEILQRLKEWLRD